MNLYFLLLAICILAPITAWVLYSLEPLNKKIFFLLVLVSICLTGYFIYPTLTGYGKQLLEKNTEIQFEPYVGGKIDSVLIDQRPISSLSSSIQVIQGEEIIISGWIKSKLNSGLPTKVLLLSTNQTHPSNTFSTTVRLRPDVVEHEGDPDLLQSGFNASLKITENQPIGEYYIQVIRSNKKLSQIYIPNIKILITVPNHVNQGYKQPAAHKNKSIEKQKQRRASAESNE